jgi:protein-S-isoprenylcysteine O-methyltransferase Ste14
MRGIYAGLAAGGWLLTLWAAVTLARAGVTDWRPGPIRRRVTTGPYRWLRHPMYVGHVCCVAGLLGLAAGFWAALAGMKVTELLVTEWASRETLTGDGP